MNIIDAAKALNEGKKIRRKSWDKPDFYKRGDQYSHGEIRDGHENMIDYSLEEILADDWELYEEQTPMDKEWLEFQKRDDKPTFYRDTVELVYVWREAWEAATKYFTQSK